jgi:peptidoglycan hydrolase-like protein with peptidoglycan-binding domain
MPQVPAAEKVAEPPTSLAAITPSQSAARSDPPAVAAPPREEDWTSLVSRAVRPTHSKDLIVAVQRLIRAEGYDPGMIDGTVGPRTRHAIQMYQRNGGLRPTGEIDRDLLTKLNLADRTVRVIGPLSGVAPPPVQTTSAKPASTRPAVEWTK